MVAYSLEHLTQNDSQMVVGPIQDDEALFLFALIRGMRLKVIFEIGGLSGYSAANFLKAVGDDGTVITCDVNPVPVIARNHRFIHKNALHLEAADFEDLKIEMVFFDAHDYNVQMMVFHRLRDLQIIDETTILALHDTNTHPFKSVSWAYATEQGYVHQVAERAMVNDFVKMGYHAFDLHTKASKHNENFPMRHGITVLKKFVPLVI